MKKIKVDFGNTSQDFFIGKGSCAVPGNIAGLLQVQKEKGILPLDMVLQPAIKIAKDGVITIQPLNAEPGQEINVGQIGTTRGNVNLKLVKSLDGYIRTEQGGIPEPDQLSSIVSGFLESSNVKSVDQLVAGIEQSRAYEINVKFIALSKEMDEGSAGIMRMPN